MATKEREWIKGDQDTDRKGEREQEWRTVREIQISGFIDASSKKEGDEQPIKR
uniref:Uncharacterized protein n=1 Tax=Nelumbo nucifera TaxID=4432 RepID=A0A822YYC1_NELNU|nr:TPA_asm: hypothetical protein HUJ06_007854 [Nelumbo nucifera]